LLLSKNALVERVGAITLSLILFSFVLVFKSFVLNWFEYQSRKFLFFVVSLNTNTFKETSLNILQNSSKVDNDAHKILFASLIEPGEEIKGW
jgi:hypothetical protein